MRVICQAVCTRSLSWNIKLGRVKTDTELSLTKALVELKKRARELFLTLNQKFYHLQDFLKKLLVDWSKFCLKDR